MQQMNKPNWTAEGEAKGNKATKQMEKTNGKNEMKMKYKFWCTDSAMAQVSVKQKEMKYTRTSEPGQTREVILLSI